jgi:protein arginine N-methyltransferase 1
MASNRLQRLSVGAFSAGQQLLARTTDWVRARPSLAAWVYPSAEDRYRDFNTWYFAQFGEQERMIADRRRMDFYHRAVARHIRPGDRVCDLGTGTGILAAFASRAGASRVYAIDHSTILGHARDLAAHNRIENVEFVSVHSRDFRPDAPVDVILHEQMGDCLFDESMLENVADLRDRILKPGGRILPSRFELYCEPVRLRDDRRVPFLWEMNVHGFDYSCLEPSRPLDAEYYYRRSCESGLVEAFLAHPEPAIEVDLQTVDPAGLPRELAYSRTVTNPGRIDGFAVYFQARVDDDLRLTTSPLDPERAPHWGYRVLRADRDEFSQGDVIDVRLGVESWSEPDSWRWSYGKRTARR